MGKSGFEQFAKFILIGCVNTLMGLICIFLLLKIGTSVYLANLVGYLLGFMISYLLNTKVTFNKNYNKSTFTKFVISQILAYLLNLIAISIFLKIHSTQIYIAQFVGMIFFTIPNFLINKFWALK